MTIDEQTELIKSMFELFQTLFDIQFYGGILLGVFGTLTVIEICQFIGSIIEPKIKEYINRRKECDLKDVD